MNEARFNKILKMELVKESPIIPFMKKGVQDIKITTQSWWGAGEVKESIVSPTNEYNYRSEDKDYVNYYIYVDETGETLDVDMLTRIKYFLQVHQNNGNLKLPEDKTKGNDV